MPYSKLLLFSITLLFTSSLFGQSQFGKLLDVDSSKTFELEIGANAFYQSSSVSRNFASFFLFGGRIEDDLINEELLEQKESNVLAANVNASVNLKFHHIHLGLNEKYGMQINLASKSIASLSYTKDFFGLAFRGNASYLGDSLDLSGSRLNFQSYNKVGFGLFNRVTGSGLSLNFIATNAMAHADFKDAYFYTNSAADSIALTLNGDANYTSGAGVFKAYGLGLDFNYNLKFGQDNDKFKGVLSLRVQDLGFVYAKDLVEYKVSNTIRFDGASFDEANTLFNQNESEILDSLKIYKDEVNKVQLLPGYIEIAKIVEEQRKDKWQSFFGVRLYPTLVNTPSVFGGLHYRLNEKWSMGGQLNYGNFGGLRGGFYTRCKLRKLDLYLASQDVVSLVHKGANGYALQFGLRWKY